MADRETPPPAVIVSTATDLDPLLPLIAGYQRFYRSEPSEVRNLAFFARFLPPHPAGMLLVAHQEGRAVGFATLYWSQSSVSARDIVVLNDLYVDAAARRHGVGGRLLEAALAEATLRGAGALRWMTAPDNAVARRVYDRLPARQSTWIEYSIER